MNTKQEITNRFNQIGKDVKDAGRNVWLAGLGAVSSFDQRGRGMFDDLVERGREEVDADRGRVLAPWRQTRDRMKTMGRKLERDVEDRMTTVLHRLGIPARHDVRLLIDRVEHLTRKVESLSKS